MKTQPEPNHPIIDVPHTYELLALEYRRSKDAASENYLDLVLERDGETRHLRFFGPVDLRIGSGFPSTEGLEFIDVSNRQLDGLTVWVHNFENSGGCPEFFARDVVEIPVSNTGPIS